MHVLPAPLELRPTLQRAAVDLGYLTVALATSAVALAVWITSITVSLTLAVFVVGIPVIVGWAIVHRWVADLDRRNAALVLGHPLASSYRDQSGLGWWARVGATLSDPQTSRDLVWLIVHSVVGMTLGSVAVWGAASVVALATAPLWYAWLPIDPLSGVTVDSPGWAVFCMLLAVPAAALLVGLLRVMALGHARLAAALLGPSGLHGAASAPWSAATSPSPQERLAGADHGAALGAHAASAVLVALLSTLVWALTGAGYLWPQWVWLGLGTAFAAHAAVVRALSAGEDPTRKLRAKAELFAGITVLCVVIWAMTGADYLWPVWPALGMSTALAVRALVTYRHRLPWVRERVLSERVDELTRTRSGALDVQAAELRRIERDLHDGAQARLVSLSMLIGRAEERLADQPETAALMRQARAEAGAAIAELRDLARGIAPPVLADRGLPAAVQALATRAPMDVAVDVDGGRRPPPVVETAAYFVVAEALTNVAKHGGGAPARVAVAQRDGRLRVEVADDGPGGATATGSGLTGLRARVEALDGSLAVESPPGAGTTVRAELPCAS